VAMKKGFMCWNHHSMLQN